ncbi:Excinuclease cho [Leclercia adecarboxylata]|uniref:Excinuclease cho n=1 Tax=Leclercia adecarboxylata TaxID=83655 RepID=A0A4U9HS07_9ENTR|nr:Excinuclease cho [Leclercia adecarboxylata]
MSRRQSAPRLEFEAAAIYEYPEHLRPWLEALPKQPGVYFFHGDSDAMPLYIGKSVNIRSRVLSHLRTPDEAAMLRQSRRITWIQTAGELGALLAGSPFNQGAAAAVPINGCAAIASSAHCRSPRANRR